jgi:hypothetical protein
MGRFELMRHDKELTFLKLVAVGTALFYLYKLHQKNGGTLAGKYNPEKIANLAAQLVPPEYRGHARQFGTTLLNRIIQ